MTASRLTVALAAAHEAGALIRARFGDALAVETKADASLVTQVDRDSEAIIRRVLLGAFPHDGFWGEESGASGDAEAIWCVDPIDGSSNFVHGLGQVGVSIGFVQRGAFVLGVILQPFTEELVAAESGGGAFSGSKPIRVSAQRFEEGLHVLDGSFSESRRHDKLAYLNRLTAEARRIRVLGSNAVQLLGVARGQFVTSLCDNIEPYDYAAGVVLVREAGGACGDERGNPPTLKTRRLLAASSVANFQRARSLYSPGP